MCARGKNVRICLQKENWQKKTEYNADALHSVKCVKSKLLPNRVLVIAANQSTVKLSTHSACYQTSPDVSGATASLCMCYACAHADTQHWR